MWVITKSFEGVLVGEHEAGQAHGVAAIGQGQTLARGGIVEAHQQVAGPRRQVGWERDGVGVIQHDTRPPERGGPATLQGRTSAGSQYRLRFGLPGIARQDHPHEFYSHEGLKHFFSTSADNATTKQMFQDSLDCLQRWLESKWQGSDRQP